MPAHYEHILEAEKRAETIEEWCPTLIPGLLETAVYTRAVVRATLPLATDEEVEEKVSARMARAHLFQDDHKTPEYWVILPSTWCAARSSRRSRWPISSTTSRHWRGATGSFHRSSRGTVARTPSW